jgi:3-oxoisoapionate decarboxylase
MRACDDSGARSLASRSRSARSSSSLSALSHGLTAIVSWGLMMGPFESALRSARLLEATIIRCGLTTVLCGDRHALGDKWTDLVADVREALAVRGSRAHDEGRILAIENHQDFGSTKLVAFCEETRGVGVCLDTGNAFPVAEAPLDFTRRVASYGRRSADDGFFEKVARALC